MGRPVMQWQMVTKDPERAAKFYGELFGWRVDPNNALGYRVVDTCSERGIDGGIWPAPAGAPSFAQLFVEVEDVGATVRDATARGATVIVPPQALPDGDEMAVLLDPNGMSFGVMKSAKE
jgi:predicted enzyme related to lactoylglutathione lyase